MKQKPFMMLKHLGEKGSQSMKKICNKLCSVLEGDECWKIKENCIRKTEEFGQGTSNFKQCGQGRYHEEDDI